MTTMLKQLTSCCFFKDTHLKQSFVKKMVSNRLDMLRIKSLTNTAGWKLPISPGKDRQHMDLPPKNQNHCHLWPNGTILHQPRFP